MLNMQNKVSSACKVPGTELLVLVAVLLSLCCCASLVRAEQQYTVTGMLLKVEPSRQAIVVSCKEVPGYMQAMVMSFAVGDPRALETLKPGDAIDFALVIKKDSSYAENIRAVPFESLELDPTETRRLKLLEQMITHDSPAMAPLAVGQAVPDFTLIDQDRNYFKLSQLAGKVVAVSFIYTRCPRPEYCFRVSNNFGRLQKQFKERMGRDLVLLSIVIDPAHDQPDALTHYARIWKAQAGNWYFLTGPLPVVQRVCRRFDMSFYPDEALLLHSFRTAVIDRQGKMAALLDGNEYTFQQLSDLVESTLDQHN